MYPMFHPLYLYIKLFIRHCFMCLGCPTLSHQRSHISEPIWDIYKILSVFKAQDLLSDHHLCQVAPKLQRRSPILEPLQLIYIMFSIQTQHKTNIFHQR